MEGSHIYLQDQGLADHSSLYYDHFEANHQCTTNLWPSDEICDLVSVECQVYMPKVAH
jgi:hypothetical protein